MRRVGILGMGHVGATVAYTLFSHGIVDELDLFDQNEAKVSAEYNDLRDTLARNNYYVKVRMPDWQEMKDIPLLVTAFGNIKASVETKNRMAEFPINSKNARELGTKLKQSGFKGIIINISNPCDAVTTVLQETTGLPKKQVFGTGTFLDTARMQRIVGEAMHEDPRNVNGFVLGEHGSSQFIAWSTVSLNGKSADELFSKAEQAKLNKQPNKNSMKVGTGKGYTSYAIATCCVKLIEAVFSNAHLFAPASVYVPRYQTYIGNPAVIGRHGVEKIVELKLTPEEEEEFKQSAAYIQKHLDQFD